MALHRRLLAVLPLGGKQGKRFADGGLFSWAGSFLFSVCHMAHLVLRNPQLSPAGKEVVVNTVVPVVPGEGLIGDAPSGFDLLLHLGCRLGDMGVPHLVPVVAAHQPFEIGQGRQGIHQKFDVPRPRHADEQGVLPQKAGDIAL